VHASDLDRALIVQNIVIVFDRLLSHNIYHKLVEVPMSFIIYMNDDIF